MLDCATSCAEYWLPLVFFIRSGQLSLIQWEAMADKVGWHINNKEYVCAILAIDVLVWSPLCHLDGISVPSVGSVFCANERCIFWYSKIWLCVRVNLKLLVVNFESPGYLDSLYIIICYFWKANRFKNVDIVCVAADNILRRHMSVSWKVTSLFCLVHVYVSQFIC